MLTGTFGIEIEMTGITREKAAKIIEDEIGGEITRLNDSYDTKEIKGQDERKWKIVSDSSIRKENVRGKTTNGDYSVEVVSPILTETDIDLVQRIARKLRAGGAKTNDSCGIHIHLDGSNHTVQSLSLIHI